MEKQTIHFNPPLGGHLLEDININSNTNNEENEENCRKTATHLDVHANAKINNLNNKQMEKYILFHFTDESTLAAPKCDLRINFSNSPYEVVNRLELKLKNIIAVKLNKPATEKEINSWLNKFLYTFFRYRRRFIFFNLFFLSFPFLSLRCFATLFARICDIIIRICV